MNPTRKKIEVQPGRSLRLPQFRWREWAMAALVIVNPLFASAQPSNGPAQLDFSSFKIITERNIFNPNRSARSVRSGRREPRKLVRTEFFSLVGTMSYEKGLFAFFDGTRSEYRMVLKSADAIAGYKVANIMPNYVKLASATNELEMRVGMQMRREEGGEWLLTTRTEPSAASPSQTIVASARPETAVTDGESETELTEAEPDTIVTNAAPGAVSTGGESDILKKLMQRREQELKR